MLEQQQTFHQKAVSLTLVWCLLFAPLAGCSGNSDSADVAGEQASGGPDSDGNVAATDAETSFPSAAWHWVTESTSSGLTIVSGKCKVGSEMVLDATKTAWIWSADTSADGWSWIVDNAGEATQWASDGIGQTWAITRQSTGEFSLWVQVKAENGVAWARTTLPETWKVVKDGAGDAWIWIDEHKVEVAVAVAVITVVVAALIVVPEAVAPAIVRGSVAGTASEATTFLADAWNDRHEGDQAATLKDVSKDLFLSIGRSVISQCGSQIVGGSVPATAIDSL